MSRRDLKVKKPNVALVRQRGASAPHERAVGRFRTSSALRSASRRSGPPPGPTQNVALQARRSASGLLAVGVLATAAVAWTSRGAFVAGRQASAAPAQAADDGTNNIYIYIYILIFA